MPLSFAFDAEAFRAVDRRRGASLKSGRLRLRSRWSALQHVFSHADAFVNSDFDFLAVKSRFFSTRIVLEWSANIYNNINRNFNFQKTTFLFFIELEINFVRILYSGYMRYDLQGLDHVVLRASMIPLHFS